MAQGITHDATFDQCEFRYAKATVQTVQPTPYATLSAFNTAFTAAAEVFVSGDYTALLAQPPEAGNNYVWEESHKKDQQYTDGLNPAPGQPPTQDMQMAAHVDSDVLQEIMGEDNGTWAYILIDVQVQPGDGTRGNSAGNAQGTAICQVVKINKPQIGIVTQGVVNFTIPRCSSTTPRTSTTDPFRGLTHVARFPPRRHRVRQAVPHGLGRHRPSQLPCGRAGRDRRRSVPVSRPREEGARPSRQGDQRLGSGSGRQGRSRGWTPRLDELDELLRTEKANKQDIEYEFALLLSTKAMCLMNFDPLPFDTLDKVKTQLGPVNSARLIAAYVDAMNKLGKPV